MYSYLDDHNQYSDLYLPKVTANDPTLTRLEYKGRNFKDTNASKLASAMEANNVIKQLLFSDNLLTDEGFTKIVNMLEKNSSVTELDFENNCIGDRGVRTLLYMLRKHNHTVVAVNLKRNRVGDDLLRDVSLSCLLNQQPKRWKQYIVEVYDSPDQRIDLDLSTNTDMLNEMVKNEHLLAKAQKQQRVIALGDPIVQVSKVGCQLLSDCLKNCENVVSLNLSGNELGDEKLNIILMALVENKSVSELNCSANNLTCDCAITLAEVLRSNKTLANVYLNNNNIGDMGCTSLVECMQVNRSIIMIDLKLNNISPQKLNQLLHCLMMNSQPKDLLTIIPELQLNSSKHSSLDFSHYTDPTSIKMNDISARVLYNTLRMNTTVKHVNLSNNHLTDEGVFFIAQLLEFNKTIQSCILNNNNISDRGVARIIEMFSVNSSIKQFEVEGNPVSPYMKRQLSIAVELNFEPLVLKKLSPLLQANDVSVQVLHLQYKEGSKTDICTPRTCEIICNILENNSTLTELDLSNNRTIERTGLVTLLGFLQNNRTNNLKVVNIARTGMDDSLVPLLADALSENNKLKTLDISGNSITSLLPVIRIISSVNYAITGINCVGNRLSSEEENDIDLLVRLNTQPPNFKNTVLNLYRNESNLTDLNLCEYECITSGQYRYAKRYDDVSCDLLCISLQNNTTLKSLNFSNNRITDAGVYSICSLLGCNSTLAVLHLSNNLITDDGGTALMKALLQNPYVTLVTLDNNKISPDVKSRINQIVQSNNLRGNSAVYSKGIMIPTDSQKGDPHDQSLEDQILQDALKNVDRLLQSNTKSLIQGW